VSIKAQQRKAKRQIKRIPSLFLRVMFAENIPIGKIVFKKD